MPIFIETIDKGWVNLQHVAVALPVPAEDAYQLLAVDATDLGKVDAQAFLDAVGALELAVMGKEN